MARRSPGKVAAEERLIAEAEAARDDPATQLHPVQMRIAEGTTAVLSVRLPLDELRALRRLAEARGVSISGLLQEAVAALLAGGAAVRFSSGRAKQVTVYTAGFRQPESEAPGPTVVVSAFESPESHVAVTA